MRVLKPCQSQEWGTDSVAGPVQVATERNWTPFGAIVGIGRWGAGIFTGSGFVL